MKKLIYLILPFIVSCQSTTKEPVAVEQAETNELASDQLPFYGPMEVAGNDTLFHTIPYFAFQDQNKELFTSDELQKKVYVAYFFFTSCPSICPVMTKQMARIQKAFENEEVNIVGFTVDPERDSSEALKAYMQKMELSENNLHFLTGKEEELYDVGWNGFMVNASEDEKAEGGFLHSDLFLLIDKKSRVRGVYQGTSPTDVDRLIGDLPSLL